MSEKLGNSRECYTCLQEKGGEMVDLQEVDQDQLSFLFKLKSCVTENLERSRSMQICRACLRQLRQSYEFREMVLASQRVLLERFEAKREIKEEDLGETGQTEQQTVEVQSDDDRNENDEKKLEESVQCEYCSSIFNKEWHLRRHKARVHSQTKRFVCDVCNKEFKQSYHLREHVSSHTGEKNHTCSLCEKTFQRISSMRRHLKTHQAAPGQKTKRTPFLCNICGKNFPFSNGVQRHMRIHTGVRNHECKECNRRFAQSTHLQVHMRTHTGEKPYICETCGETFSLNAGLQKHRSVHESAEEAE